MPSLTKLCSSLSALLFIGSSAVMAVESTDSRILRLHFNDLVDSKYDVEVILHERDGILHHGYALLPEVDNLPHRIDLTPSLPIAFKDRDGKIIDVPKEMQGRYSYKNPNFNKWKGRYESGDIDIVPTQQVEPLTASSSESISGMLDVLIMKVDEANSAGRNNSSQAFRLNLDLKLNSDGQVVSGSAMSHSYNNGDWSFGSDAPKRQIAVSGGWASDAWKAAANTEFADGTDWPMAHGPMLTGHAADFDGKLVDNLHDARLLWVAEDTLPSGRSGGRSRGGFAMQPYSWTTTGFGGYAAPIIADDKVFVFVHTADMDAINKHPETAKDPFVKLGVEKESLGTVLNLVRDTVYAYDAQTGKRLWAFHGATGGLSRVSKGGMASTPCFYDGKIFARGQGGVYALDANSGDVMWHNKGFGIHSAPAEGSITEVGGSLILVNSPKDHPAQLIALNPEDGSVKWKHERLGSAATGIPAIYEENGKQYLVTARPTWKPGKRFKGENKSPTKDSFLMIDPVNGDILWESDALASSFGNLLVQGNMALGNVVKDLSQVKKKASEQARMGGARISTKGAELVWTNDQVHHVHQRAVNVIGGAQHQFFVNDSRVTKFNVVDIQSGKTVAKLPHIYHLTQGSHNWTWHITAADRVFTSGVAMFQVNETGMDLLPGRLSLDITSGYRAPTKPAFADGRIVLRLADKLVCYDLRQQPNDQTEVIHLIAKNAVPSAAAAEARDVHIRLRKQGNQLISAGAKVGRQAGPEQWSLINWAGDWSGAMPWRKTLPEQLSLDDSGLNGTVALRMGWQFEPFELNLTRNGTSFEGTYSRIIPALSKPIANAGSISGSLKTLENGQQVYHLSLAKAVGGLGNLKNGVADQNFEAFLIMNKDGTLSHGWGASGRMNTVTHEVDASGLNFTDGDLTGELKIITHDDQYQDLHFDKAVEKMAASADGPALGISYTIAVELSAAEEGAEPTLTGTFEGTIGAELRYDGSIEGSIAPEPASIKALTTP